MIPCFLGGDSVGFKQRRKLGLYFKKTILTIMWLIHWRGQDWRRVLLQTRREMVVSWSSSWSSQMQRIRISWTVRWIRYRSWQRGKTEGGIQVFGLDIYVDNIAKYWVRKHEGVFFVCFLYFLVGRDAYDEEWWHRWKTVKFNEITWTSWCVIFHGISPNQEVWIPVPALLLSSCVTLGRSPTSLIYNYCISKIWILVSVHSFHKYWTYSTCHTCSKALGMCKRFCFKEFIESRSNYCVGKQL